MNSFSYLHEMFMHLRKKSIQLWAPRSVYTFLVGSNIPIYARTAWHGMSFRDSIYACNLCIGHIERSSHLRMIFIYLIRYLRRSPYPQHIPIGHISSYFLRFANRHFEVETRSCSLYHYPLLSLETQRMSMRTRSLVRCLGIEHVSCMSMVSL